jgi:hypothetical protein
LKAINTKAISVAIDRFLWAVLMAPILGISGWSLYWVATYLHSPVPVAVALSTCFDGVAIIAAKYSVRYAQANMSGSFPRTVVRVFAGVGAYLQTLHARLGHEPAGAQVLWGSLPIAAAVVYEIHLRWEKRKAMSAAGAAYPRPLPSFGLTAWLLFPWPTYKVLRGIVKNRIEHLDATARVTLNPSKANALEEPKAKPVVKAKAEPVEAPVDAEVPAPPKQRPAKPKRVYKNDELTLRREKTRAMRVWAREHGWPNLGDTGQIPREAESAYDAAHQPPEAEAQ